MEKFYVDLDDFGQVTLSIRERNILLVTGLVFMLAFAALLWVSTTQSDIYFFFGLIHSLLCLAVAVGCIMLYRGRNIYHLPLGTFFQLDNEKISYKFSVFAATKIYRWEAIQYAEMSLFVVHFRIRNAIREIDFEEIRNRRQQTVIKQKVREALVRKGLLNAAA